MGALEVQVNLLFEAVSLESQVAQSRKPLYLKVDHNGLKEAFLSGTAKDESMKLSESQGQRKRHIA